MNVISDNSSQYSYGVLEFHLSGLINIFVAYAL